MATDPTSTNEHGVVPTKLDLACGLWFANLCLSPAGLSKPHNFLSIFSIMLQSTSCFQFAGHWAQTYIHGRSLAFFPFISVTKSDILPNYHVTKHIASSFAISFLWLLFMSGGHRCSEEWPSYVTENKPIVYSWRSGLDLGLADPTQSKNHQPQYPVLFLQFFPVWHTVKAWVTYSQHVYFLEEQKELWTKT